MATGGPPAASRTARASRSLARSAIRLARARLGVDIRRTSAGKANRPAPPVPSAKTTVLFDVDTEFRAIYAEAVARTGGGQPLSEARIYNLVQALAFTRGAGGLVVECGVFRGLSSYVLCRYLQLEDPGFTGVGLHLFDSFEGLSEPAPADRIDDPSIPVAGVPRRAGLFKGPLDDVRRALADFPDVTFHQGWIPAVFDDADPGPYRLVHVDVDLHDPTRDSLACFHPRLASGGVIVCDDYGFVRWPGARTAVDQYCADHRLPVLSLSSAQAFVFAARP